MQKRDPKLKGKVLVCSPMSSLLILVRCNKTVGMDKISLQL